MILDCHSSIQMDERDSSMLNFKKVFKKEGAGVSEYQNQRKKIKIKYWNPKNTRIRSYQFKSEIPTKFGKKTLEINKNKSRNLMRIPAEKSWIPDSLIDPYIPKSMENHSWKLVNPRLFTLPLSPFPTVMCGILDLFIVRIHF